MKRSLPEMRICLWAFEVLGLCVWGLELHSLGSSAFPELRGLQVHRWLRLQVVNVDSQSFRLELGALKPSLIPNIGKGRLDATAQCCLVVFLGFPVASQFLQRSCYPAQGPSTKAPLEPPHLETVQAGCDNSQKAAAEGSQQAKWKPWLAA